MSRAVERIKDTAMSQAKEILIKPHEEIVWVALECERMEDEHASAMQTEVAAAAENAPGLPVVLDMSKVRMLPSMSIGALVALWQKLKESGQRFMLAGLQPEVRRTLTTCRLDKVFEICDGVDEALSRVRQSS